MGTSPELWKAGLMRFIGKEREGSSEARGGEKHGRQGALTLPGSSSLAILGKRIAFDPHT